MDTELWKDIIGYEGRYQVSNLGRVKSLARYRAGKNGSLVPIKEKIMRTPLKKKTNRTMPYAEVKLRDGGPRTEPCKSFLVHRLVATAFIRPLNDGEQVDHLNGIHDDNRVENLRILHYTEHGRAHPVFSSTANKTLFQQQAQDAIKAKRNAGWKPTPYIRTKLHRAQARLSAIATIEKLGRDEKGRIKRPSYTQSGIT